MKKLHAKAWGFFSLLASRPTNRHGPYSYISLSGQEFRICFLLLAAKSYVVYTRHLWCRRNLTVASSWIILTVAYHCVERVLTNRGTWVGVVVAGLYY